MINWPGRKRNGAMGFLARLSKDTRANVMAIVAASIVPLIGMVGGGFDLSRMYIVKTRLQHACDAGALAGRKAMGSGQWSQNSYKPRQIADQYFDANIESDAYGSTSVDATFAESAGKVTGVATAQLPMTLMRVFGRTTETLTVACDAEMRLANTDVMFVLDVTGSMDQNIPGDSTRKMDGLKKAVKCFYEIVARLDTDAACDGDAPSGGTGDQVQLRFGFVPYNTNVNVGRLIPSEYFRNEFDYQGRTYQFSGWTVQYDTDWESCGKTNSTTQLNTEFARGYDWRGREYCRYRRQDYVDVWRYHQRTINVGGLKTGDRRSFTRTENGRTITTAWPGCIEERKTVKAGSYWPIPNTAYDLDINLLPTNDDTRWAPALPSDVFVRRSGSASGTGAFDDSAVDTYARYANPADYCPTEARKLQEWPNASNFEDYVDSLTPSGNTYHDIGILWGARFLSANGIFKSENEFTNRGGEIDRHLIFMTDGDTVANNYDYTAYGVGWFDQRQTSSRPSNNDMNNQVNARFTALCNQITNMAPQGITLWVISFGDATNATTNQRLKDCATADTYYFHAANSTQLQQTFRRIADDISQLRLTR
ncbi:pilus assembly protein TadG-related protein [Sphingomonas sp. S1-29]|uniref:TadE/TadG family type IV pilus assembly protein n=1 Tax=Sphingomonas sp. S1-29 TaxID=2991074 RepID=UPI00224066AF|nr:TadE/TadG family type IV pilus assembly protein [Sphingomonas sp. S1-29]UZK70116.1 pilus assembly protein TadG-related protein [Sphingomonas sp. S1-29]